MGLVHGEYGGRSDEFKPGGASFETGMTPHGVAYLEFKAAPENIPPVMQTSEGALAFVFESSCAFTISDFAWNSEKLHSHDPNVELLGQ
jgi:homogentisate 1,2-dioxygenase